MPAADRASAPSSYRGRFAPSPTGPLHLGLARTALLAYLRARSAGGRLVLRMEDLDGPRVVAGAAAALMDDLRFLGIDWDEGPDVGGDRGPYVQSARSALYAEAIARLRDAGRVYRCTCSRKEIAIASAPHGPSDWGPVYPGTCRRGPSHPERAPALRFVAPDPLASFVDALMGEVKPAAQGDFVLQRADGLFSYQLAVVVDDIAMGITEAVRGADLAGCTGWQLSLYEALGEPPPSFVHVPLLHNAEGKRLSKRDGATAVASLRAAGKTGPEIIGELAAGLGLVPAKTAITPAQLVPQFSLGALRRSVVK